MNQQEVQAAADRVRRWKNGEWLSSIYPGQPFRQAEVALLERDWRDLAVAYLADQAVVPVLIEACQLAAEALGKAGLTAEGTRGAMALEKIEQATALASLYPKGGH